MTGLNFFASDEHDHALTAILSHLDWRSLLAASATCRNLNRIVTCNSSLQVELRAQYYGFPDWYGKWLKDGPGSASAKIERLMSVQKNWCNLTPKTIYRLPGDARDADGQPFPVDSHLLELPSISCGLVAQKMLSPSSEDDGERHLVGWVITDLTHSRNLSVKELPSWAYATDFRFDDIDVCREDNAVGVITTRIGAESHLLDGILVYCRIHVFLAEPDERTHGVNTAIPHPDARDVEVCGLCPLKYVIGGRVRWMFRLSPGGIAEVGIAARNGWVAVDWRTGQQLTVRCEYGDGLEMKNWGTMLRGQAQLLMASDNSHRDGGDDERDIPTGSIQAPLTRPEGHEERGLEGPVFRFEHALPPNDQHDPGTVEAFVEIPRPLPLLEELANVTPGQLEYLYLGVSFDPHGRLFLLSASPVVHMLSPEEDKESLRLNTYVTSARLGPLRRMVQERARPPRSSFSGDEFNRTDGFHRGADGGEDPTESDGHETSSEKNKNFGNWEKGAALPNPHSPTLTASLRRADVAQYFTHEFGGPYFIDASQVMGLRAVHLAFDHHGGAAATTLLVGDYAARPGGDVLHRHPMGAALELSGSNRAKDVARHSCKEQVIPCSDDSVRLTAAWDWSTESRRGVAAYISTGNRNPLIIRADAEHVYLISFGVVFVLSF
ncbi:hypothetical protein CcaverHIS002_0308400 [Cutaneotrichosporon cavernicola]|uniref:F-box domain-containing protein n=1 Tax=Cutaneotrichosporon cavernicola TaxID=279322 RepID=A0AA48L2F3_9TREE|nr:uncharacterized protein CcaverHIS019_0308270 [Cutaneotrichosporon cavernicola]BEI82972.1 hypothetical protein CcaverHIS002_0308400 [Cutaneotrichosporon cavernicola]BEI90757.1 hypothetical protein CcaverHIS019_0308270 [Cutaneotrichosporon cavernicola]BEI98537.1 hypothetical protein CcaverHIS631_0308360 [Cutaneotrichosporon cavernicola]BEJ06308.1 hypothetical protein CcaverHIS641_0308300 [Cutaneotrichosporon cavernicola]